MHKGISLAMATYLATYSVYTCDDWHKARGIHGDPDYILGAMLVVHGIKPRSVEHLFPAENSDAALNEAVRHAQTMVSHSALLVTLDRLLETKDITPAQKIGYRQTPTDVTQFPSYSGSR